MIDYNNTPLLSVEYDKEHYKIVCTPEYFMNKIDHTKLNKGHYFIQVIDPRFVNFPPFIKFPIQLRLVWANSTSSEEQPKCLIIDNINMEKSIIRIPREQKEAIEEFKKAKFWQVEIVNKDTYVLTAPKKPKIILY